MRNKKSRPQDSLITMIITTASIIAFIGGYVLSSGLTTKNFYSVKYIEKEDDIVSANGSLTDDLSFNENNVYDRDIDLVYSISFPTYTLDENTNYTIEYGNSNYEIVLGKNVDNNLEKEYKIEFDLKVVDVAVIDTDNNEKDAVLYLLEDGTIEYTLMSDAIEKDFVRTNGRLNEAINIVKFINGKTCNKETNLCEKAIYAQSIDGMLYNLDEMI